MKMERVLSARGEDVNEWKNLKKRQLPYFEEGSMRLFSEMSRYLKWAHRGRSEPCCDSGMTSPAAPSLR